MTRLAGGKSPENVLRYLEDVRYPAKKDDLVHAARQSGASPDVVAALSQMPQVDFHSADEVIEAYPHLG